VEAGRAYLKGIHVYMHTHTYVCIYVYVCVCVCVCVCTGLGLVVINTSALLQALAGGVGLDEAREALVLDYLNFGRSADGEREEEEEKCR